MEEPKADSTEAAHPADPIPDELVPTWKEWREQFDKLGKYLRTRRALLAGSALWDLSKGELESQRLLGPWAFNVFQSVLSAAPALVLGAIVNALFPAHSDAELSASLAKEFFKLEPTPEILEAYDTTWKVFWVLLPITIPFGLALTSFAAARGSLAKEDQSVVARRRARRAYLYFDGVYGLWPQLLLAFIPLLSVRDADPRYAAYYGAFDVITVLFWIPFLAQAWLSGVVIPKRLFAINGYSTAYPSFKIWSADPNRRRWVRFVTFTLLFGGLLTRLLPLVAIVVATVVSMALLVFKSEASRFVAPK